MYTPIPGRFKDYIAMPKPNMYQSLHTTLIEFSTDSRLRSRSVQKRCIRQLNMVSLHTGNIKKPMTARRVWQAQEEEKLSWLRQILEWQRDMSDNQRVLEPDQRVIWICSAEDVYCFTPQGDVKNLPNGSTPIDFAYAIHSAVGNKMVGARVNGKLVNY